ncbi:MAG: dihydroorotate dehydrogenase [Planctomycetota bacterium]
MLTTTLGRLALKNPILVASGTFGYAREASGFVEIARLGGVVPKTVTMNPRAGNKPPRIVETASGMLNAIGLDNDGIVHFLHHHLPYLRSLGTSVIVNIAGKTEAEFPEMAAMLADAAGVDAVELNLSCPNVAGGTDFATNPATTERVIAAVRKQCPHPILAKLTPNVTDIVAVARAAEAGGADAVTLINTLFGTAIDWRRKKPLLGNVFGGLSGPAIKPVALRMVLQVASASKIPIIGVGGIGTIDDVMEFLVAGARAVQVGTANFYDPTSSMRILDQLPQSLASIGAQSVSEVVGTVRLGG